MRLIDADKLKAELKKLPMMSNWGESFMPELIDEQPTAYDIDKVVEQLEYALKDCIPRINGKECNKREKTVYEMALEYAIEIVKCGGEQMNIMDMEIGTKVRNKRSGATYILQDYINEKVRVLINCKHFGMDDYINENTQHDYEVVK